MENLTKLMQTIHINKEVKTDKDKLSTGKYFLHIDLEGVGQKAGRTGVLINKYMLRRGNFDPRKSTNFIDEVLGEGESLETETMVGLREIAQMSQGYYEFWCVRSTFDIDDMATYLRQNIDWSVTVHVYKIIDNDIQRFRITF